MDVLKELTQLLESQKRVAIGKSRGPAKIGQSVNVEISSSLLGKRGVVRAIALTPISSSGIEVGLTIDDRKRIVAVSKAQEELSRDVIINDRWDAEEKPKPKGSSSHELGGVVLFAALKEVPKPNAVTDCTCPTLNYAQPTAGDKQFKSCKEELEASKINFGPIQEYEIGASAGVYACYRVGGAIGAPYTQGFPMGFSSSYEERNYWLPADLETTGPFIYENGSHRGISYWRSTNKVNGGDLLIYDRRLSNPGVVVLRSPINSLNLIFGRSYGDYYWFNSSKTEEEKLAILVDLGTTNSISEVPATYKVRREFSTESEVLTIEAVEYQEWQWQIIENHLDINSPILETYIVVMSGIRGSTPAVESGESYRKLNFTEGFIFQKTADVSLDLVPRYVSGGGGSGDDSGSENFFDEDGASLGGNKYYNTKFYIGGFSDTPFELPLTLRGDDPCKGIIDRIGPNRYQIVILSGTHQMKQTKANADYLSQHAPWMVGDTWDYVRNEAPTNPEAFGGAVRRSSNFRACEAKVFVVRVLKGVVTIEKNESYSFPDTIPNYGEPFKDGWYHFVLNIRHFGNKFYSFWSNDVDASFTSLNRNSGIHNFDLTGYRGRIEFRQHLNYSETPLPEFDNGFVKEYPREFFYSPNYIKSLVGADSLNFGPIDLKRLIPDQSLDPFADSPLLKKYTEITSIYIKPYLHWLVQNKPQDSLNTKYENINPLYWITEEDYSIEVTIGNIDTQRSLGTPVKRFIGTTELISACRLVMSEKDYPITEFNPTNYPTLTSMPNTIERSNYVINNFPITFGLSMNITDIWLEGINGLSSTNRSTAGFIGTNEGTAGNLEVPIGVFKQSKKLEVSNFRFSGFEDDYLFPNKLTDIEIETGRTRVLPFYFKCEAEGQLNMSLGTALMAIDVQESNYKIKGAVLDLKHEYIENYGTVRYENERFISPTSLFNSSSGKYAIKTETFDIVKLKKVDIELGPNSTASRPDYTLKTISLYPVRQPDFYAICLFGMQTYDDRIKSANTPEEEE